MMPAIGIERRAILTRRDYVSERYPGNGRVTPCDKIEGNRTRGNEDSNLRRGADEYHGKRLDIYI